MSKILNLPQSADWEEAIRLRSSGLNLDNPQILSDIRLFLNRINREGDETYRRAAALALNALQQIEQGGVRKEEPEGVDVGSVLVDLASRKLSAESGWPAFIEQLASYGFSELEQSRLILFVSRRQDLVEVHIRKMRFSKDETDLLLKLLGFPDVMSEGSPSCEALALFLKYFPSGQHYQLLEFPEGNSLAILDEWDLGEGDIRVNAWVVLERPEDLVPSLLAVRENRGGHPATHVQISPSSSVDRDILKTSIFEMLAKGELHLFIPTLKEITVLNNPRVLPAQTTEATIYDLDSTRDRLTRISARNLKFVTLNDVAYQFDNPSDRRLLHQTFELLFEKKVTLNDFISVFESQETGLVIESINITTQLDESFETKVVFHNGLTSTKGEYTCRWVRKPDGHLIKTQKAWLDMGGVGHGIGIMLQARLVEFSKKCGLVDEFWIRSRGAGKHAYRFMDGVEMEEEVLHEISEKLGQWAGLYGVPLDKRTLANLKSPKKLSEFVVLTKIENPWMDIVDSVLMQTGYEFTVDQVVDIARRPGLVALLSLPEYSMKLNVRDNPQFELFTASIEEGQARRSLPRLKGVFGANFNFLPPNVRNALIVFRPYLFPRPEASPTVPDFKDREQPQSRFKVLGMQSLDGEFLPADPMDIEGTPMRDYRKEETLTLVRGIEGGTQVFTATGLSGAGKTEVLIWNLERELSQRGHRVAALDALRLSQLLTPLQVEELMEEINRALQPTIMIFDESAYIGNNRDPILRFSKRFLERKGQHIIFVGGGRISPEAQKRKITELMEPLFTGSYSTAPVNLLPKPINMTQAYRFLGLGRVDWMTGDQKREFLRYLFEKIPPYFILFMNLRLHEHPEIRSMKELFALVDREVDPHFWREELGMVIDETGTDLKNNPPLDNPSTRRIQKERKPKEVKPATLKIVEPQEGPGKKEGPDGTPKNSASSGLILGAKLVHETFRSDPPKCDSQPGAIHLIMQDPVMTAGNLAIAKSPPIVEEEIIEKIEKNTVSFDELPWGEEDEKNKVDEGSSEGFQRAGLSRKTPLRVIQGGMGVRHSLFRRIVPAL